MNKRCAKELAGVNRINSYVRKVSMKLNPVVKQEKMVEVKREAAAAVARAPTAKDVMEVLAAEQMEERGMESAVRAAKLSWLKKWKEEGLVKKEVVGGKTTGLEIAADEIESMESVRSSNESKDKLDYNGDQTDPVELLSSGTESDVEEEEEEEEKAVKEEEDDSDEFGDNAYWEEEMRKGEEAGK